MKIMPGSPRHVTPSAPLKHETEFTWDYASLRILDRAPFISLPLNTGTLSTRTFFCAYSFFTRVL